MTSTPGAHDLLNAANLSVSAFSAGKRRALIRDTSFSVRENEVLIILGESGSGKTILSRALTRLFPVTSGLRINGSVTFESQELLTLREEELSSIRRRRIRYVFQEPMQSLNPLARVGQQMRLAADCPSNNDSVLYDTLRLVGLENGKEILDLYPHQMSIGMAQRVCIAMAVLPAPALLVADEPFSEAGRCPSSLSRTTSMWRACTETALSSCTRGRLSSQPRPRPFLTSPSIPTQGC
jgi:peptide/nickel transport system ATP-binding protein